MESTGDWVYFGLAAALFFGVVGYMAYCLIRNPRYDGPLPPANPDVTGGHGGGGSHF